MVGKVKDAEAHLRALASEPVAAKVPVAVKDKGRVAVAARNPPSQ